MTTTKTGLTNAEVLAKLATAKSARDLELTMNIYHSEMVLEIPSFDAVARGEKQLRALLEVFFGIFPDYAVSLNGSTESADGQIWVLGEISVTLTPPPGFSDFQGHKPNGKRATVPAFLLCGFADERVSYENFLIDFGTICRTAGVPYEAVMATIKEKYES